MASVNAEAAKAKAETKKQMEMYERIEQEDRRQIVSWIKSVGDLQNIWFKHFNNKLKI